MHGTNVHSTLIPDVLTIVALCTESRSTTELALALNAIATGKTWFPSGPENVEMNGRIALRLLYAPWKSAARAALADPYAVYLAEHFRRVCMTCVPTSMPSDPLSDPNWYTGVQELYARERSMQMIADALVNYVEHHVGRLIAFSPDPQPLPVAAPAPMPLPTEPATVAPSAPAPPPEESRAKLIAEIELVANAQRVADELIRYYRAREAHKAAAQPAQSTTTVPAPEHPQPTEAPPITAATPKVEAIAPPAPAPAMARPTNTRKRRSVMRAAVRRARYAHASESRREVCLADTLPMSECPSLQDSPQASHPTSIPFGRKSDQNGFLDPQIQLNPKGLSPP